MTLQYMDGFESVIDTTDLTKRGWTTSAAVTVNGIRWRHCRHALAWRAVV